MLPLQKLNVWPQSHLNRTCFGVSYLIGPSVLETSADVEDEVVVEGEIGEPHVDHVSHGINGSDIFICFAGSKNNGERSEFTRALLHSDQRYWEN